MPVSVPDESKKYTTIYENFKGVDFTNDPSNVYKRRSPGGKNMLPDLDGRPYKRKGWRIEVPYTDFLEEAQSQDTFVAPKRVHHFTLGGQDYMMIFNSAGVFYMSETSDGVVKCELASYSEGEVVTESFPPQINGITIQADSGRSFFFEGNGIAGFYVFVGLNLYRFDGTYFWHVEPYVPLNLVACEASTGAGVVLDKINLLTRLRQVSYHTDGTVTDFTLINTPDGIVTGSLKVEVRNALGMWVETTAYTTEQVEATATTDSYFCVKMDTAPSEIIQGEDVLRITYAPASVGGDTVETRIASTGARNAVVEVREYYAYTRESTSDAWGTMTLQDVTETDNTSLQFPVSNITDTSSLLMNHVATATWNSYNTAVSVSVPADYVKAHGTLATEISNVVTSADKLTRSYYITKTYTLSLSGTYTQYFYSYSNDALLSSDASAFASCGKTYVYGNAVANQIFVSASSVMGYSSRVWYSATNDPSYFPDLNYIEVGATDTRVMGLMKVSGYLGIIKQGSTLDTSVYLAYPTTFDNEPVYAVKQNLNGLGAISSGAFNILNDEPLFLSKNGIMGIEVSDEETDRRIRNRSFYINKALVAEPNLDTAISYVHKGLYYLAINNHAYVLDGAQKNSWANEKTNLQYECYYVDNFPVQCFASLKGDLYFTDFNGNLCKLKTDSDPTPYRDEYSVYSADWASVNAPTTINATTTFNTSDLIGSGNIAVNQTIVYNDNWYTVTDITDNVVTVQKGVAIDAVWNTIADDDGMVHFFKNLQKKGSVISLLPMGESGVSIYLKADEKSAVYVGDTDISGNVLPAETYTKKKIKKYKRLQIICENNKLDDGFGVDQIIKTYTVGNYSKNRK